MFNKKQEIIFSYFDRKVKNALEELSPEIFQSFERIANEAISRGTLRSGMTVGLMLSELNNKTFVKLEKSLSLIDDFQNDMKILIKDKQLEVIETKYYTHFINFYKSYFNNTLKERGIQYVGEKNVLNLLNEIQLNSANHKIENTIKNKIEDIKVKNRIKTDEPSVKIGKHANRISIILMLITLVGTVTTIYLTFFY